MRRLFDIKCVNTSCTELDIIKEVFTKVGTNFVCTECREVVEVVICQGVSFELVGDGFYKSGRF